MAVRLVCSVPAALTPSVLLLLLFGSKGKKETIKKKEKKYREMAFSETLISELNPASSQDTAARPRASPRCSQQVSSTREAHPHAPASAAPTGTPLRACFGVPDPPSLSFIHWLCCAQQSPLVTQRISCSLNASLLPQGRRAAQAIQREPPAALNWGLGAPWGSAPKPREV